MRGSIEALHALYVRLTGMDVRLDMQREHIWWEWTRRGFVEADLQMVVAHLRRGIKAQRRQPGALKFSNLIGQPDFFEEDLAEAKAAARVFASRPDEGREAALRASGRAGAEGSPTPGGMPAERSAGRILGAVKMGDSEAARKALDEFRALKNKL